MLPAQRRKEVYEAVLQTGFASVSDLAKRLSVSETTIRRDLAEMEAQGMILRTHGGATLPDGLGVFIQQSVRESQRSREKRLIGWQTAELLREKGVVTMIIDGGTTTREVARHLRPDHAVTVITDSIDIAYELRDVPNVTLLVTGGMVRKGAYNLFGPHAERMFENLHVEVCIMGASGISLTDGARKLDVEANPLRKKMIEASDELWIVVDSSKFDGKGLATVATLSEIHVVITDSGISPAVHRQLEEMGVRVVVCEQDAIARTS